MYARYVPPPKGGNSSNSAPSAPSPSVTTNSAPATNAFGYSRYVPPSAKPTPQPAEVPQVQYFDDESTPSKPKRKWDSTEEAQNSPQPDNKKSKTLEPPSTTQKDGEEAPKKKKKVRRGKRRTGAINDDDDDDEPAQKPSKDKPESQKVEQQEKPVNEVQEESQTVDEDSVKDKEQKKKDKKKEKKEKKKKDKEQKQEPEVPDTPAPKDEDRNEDVSMVDATEPVKEVKDVPEPADPVVAEEEKKEKRREKKKKHKEPEPTEEPEDKEEKNKHKMVMERLEKSLKLAGETVQDEDDGDDQGELHGLEPLPQPEPISLTTSKPSYETLPPWLAEPIRVSQDTRTPFAELGIPPKASRVLEGKGFPDAFAVQTAAIPLLIPTSKQRPGDVLISAATGSGKTLAYALPVVRDLSQGAVTRLRALVVLPTRELVKQAQEAFELCAKAFEGGDRKRVRVGTSVGSQSLKNEQEALMDREVRYDPDAYKKLQEESQRQKQQKSGLSATDSLDDIDMEDTDPRLSTMNGYVVDFPSKVDVLICTPGRLVEHMEQTPGFSIDYVRWLVVDEADKLLAQSFQGWLDVVMENFRVNKFSARDFPDMDFSGVRKVILSATLTRDLSLLSQLGLQRPRLIVLESDGTVQIAEHSLPVLLKEHAIRVHDTNLKPLYLLDLLQSQDMLMASPNKDQEAPKPDKAEDSDTSSDSSSSSDSDSDSDATSDTSSDSDSDSESETKSKPSGRSLKSHTPVSLIFTKSNESALRLSRLLALLDPSLASHIGTLTSTTPTHIRRKTLRAFTEASSPIRLLIASDLVARGIDLPNLDHVINYDLPPSVAGYVHRVGRTARAGRSGSAWTLVGDDESGWFWGKIAKGAGVKRVQKMERTRIEEIDESRVEGYEAALEKLGKEAGR
ncbi:hypothetical protein FSARC_2292 [Fusarium sarcochroum]|uniref:ATP-dependent RNA helicase n=1 Tax=Fusarium sarcochroum TaxID=1208366 RepID=A0A8H4U711_9HYPO|nr:hypothetical protein FSARC_2292 [Fusarium sarcochroum]